MGMIAYLDVVAVEREGHGHGSTMPDFNKVLKPRP
jgi:hypothetical protein